jgi:hypothetical protein
MKLHGYISLCVPIGIALLFFLYYLCSIKRKYNKITILLYIYGSGVFGA